MRKYTILWVPICRCTRASVYDVLAAVCSLAAVVVNNARTPSTDLTILLLLFVSVVIYSRPSPIAQRSGSRCCSSSSSSERARVFVVGELSPGQNLDSRASTDIEIYIYIYMI